MDIDDALLDGEDRMIKTVADYDGFLKGVRTGQASTEIFDKIQVDIPSYGGHVDLKSVAVISKQDAQMVVIRPFDVKTIKDIEKGIAASDIGITPSNDGKIIRLAFPPMSEERRKQTVKLLKDRLEQHKIAMRNIRKDVMKHIDANKGKPGVSEDTVEKAHAEVNDLTKKYEGELDGAYEKKSTEIMKV